MDDYSVAGAIVDSFPAAGASRSTVRTMVFRPPRQFRPVLLAFLLPVLAACASTVAGVPQIGPSRPEPSLVPLSTTRPAPAASALRSWTSVEVTVGPAGVTSPTGTLAAQVDGSRICLVPTEGATTRCVELADGDRPARLRFSPDGRYLLVVAGPDGRTNTAYLLDTAGGAARVIGPTGIHDLTTGPPARVDTTGEAWAVDSTGVLLVPRSEEEMSPILGADLKSGRVRAVAELLGVMTGWQPDIRMTRNGAAVTFNGGPERQTLWWLSPRATSITHIALFPEEGGAQYLVAADPSGAAVVLCAQSAGGHLQPTEAIGVQSRATVRVLPDSDSCAGAAFFPDGGQVALTASVAGRYTLIVVDAASNRRLLTAPLPVAEPTRPPELTWFQDTVVATDVTGEWAMPSLVVRLR